MATYYSDVYVGPNAFVQEPHCGARTVVGKLTIPAGTAVATGDVLKLMKVGVGVFFHKVYLWNSDWGTDVPGIFGLATQDDNAILTDVVLETARTSEPYIGVNDGITSAGPIAETAFAAKLVTTSAADELQITIGTVTGGTATGEKTLTFAAQLIDINSARGNDIAFNYGGYSSLSAATST